MNSGMGSQKLERDSMIPDRPQKSCTMTHNVVKTSHLWKNILYYDPQFCQKTVIFEKNILYYDPQFCQKTAIFEQNNLYMTHNFVKKQPFLKNIPYYDP